MPCVFRELPEALQRVPKKAQQFHESIIPVWIYNDKPKWEVQLRLPLLIKHPGGLVVEMTDGTAGYNRTNYRVSILYNLTKISVIRMAWAHAHELKPYHCTAVAMTPGWLRSELMLDIYGVTEANWRDACAKQPDCVISKSPRYVDRAMAHLAADPDVARWSGQSLSSSQLTKKYDCTDLDGSQITLWAISNKTYPGSVRIKNHAQEWDPSTLRSKSTPRAFVNHGAAAHVASGIARARMMIVNMSKARQRSPVRVTVLHHLHCSRNTAFREWPAPTRPYTAELIMAHASISS